MTSMPDPGADPDPEDPADGLDRDSDLEDPADDRLADGRSAAGESADGESAAAPADDDDHIRALVARLARPHRSGGRVIERASLLAAGDEFGAAMAWIEAHGGTPEPRPAAPPSRGVHSARLSAGGPADTKPLRFLLPNP